MALPSNPVRNTKAIEGPGTDAWSFVGDGTRWQTDPAIYSNFYETPGTAEKAPEVVLGNILGAPQPQNRIRFTSTFRTNQNSRMRFRFGDAANWFNFGNATLRRTFSGAANWSDGGVQNLDWCTGTNANTNGITLNWSHVNFLTHREKLQVLDLDMIRIDQDMIMLCWNFHMHSEESKLVNTWCTGILDYDITQIGRLSIYADTDTVFQATLHVEWI
jgi:hypothetical protein